MEDSAWQLQWSICPQTHVLGSLFSRSSTDGDRYVFPGALQLFFIGLLGEYVLSINTRVLDRPLVVEEERLNFDEPEEDEE